MKTKVIKVFSFDELSERAKENARDWLRGCGFDEWWEATYEDAERIGLKITSFDLDRNKHAKGKWITSAWECATTITKEHGEGFDTYKDAVVFLRERDEIIDTAERDENGDFVDEYAVDRRLDELEGDFLKTVLEDYASLLQGEWEHLNSDEQVDEAIRANDYTFREDGTREDI